MLARRPFTTWDRARTAARHEWFALTPEEWKEAFAHHPRIGDLDALQKRFESTQALSEREQSRVGSASIGTLHALLDGNSAYEARFGYIFIVCASGKSAEEILELLQQRLLHSAEAEIGVAAEELARICELRMASRM